jgi:hypothetical protein
MMHRRLKVWLYLFGLAFPLGMTIIMYATFLVAFFTPIRVIAIDNHGEAIVEFFLLPVCIVISIVSLAMALRRTIAVEKKA